MLPKKKVGIMAEKSKPSILDTLDLPYGADEMIFPTVRDDDLWQTTYQALVAEYGPARVLLEHARKAFELVCEESADSMQMRDFLRKVRLKWLWERPPLPRGMVLGDR